MIKSGDIIFREYLLKGYKFVVRDFRGGDWMEFKHIVHAAPNYGQPQDFILIARKLKVF